MFTEEQMKKMIENATQNKDVKQLLLCSIWMDLLELRANFSVFRNQLFKMLIIPQIALIVAIIALMIVNIRMLLL